MLGELTFEKSRRAFGDACNNARALSSFDIHLRTHIPLHHVSHPANKKPRRALAIQGSTWRGQGLPKKEADQKSMQYSASAPAEAAAFNAVSFSNRAMITHLTQERNN